MTIELRKSELLSVGVSHFAQLNPRLQKQVAIRVLRRRNAIGANFVADQILRGNPNFGFVVADDVSSLT